MFNFDKIKNATGNFLSVLSDDDPFVELEKNKKIILKTSHKILYLADISKFISFLTATGGIRSLSYKCFFRRSKKKESRQLTGFQI